MAAQTLLLTYPIRKLVRGTEPKLAEPKAAEHRTYTEIRNFIHEHAAGDVCGCVWSRDKISGLTTTAAVHVCPMPCQTIPNHSPWSPKKRMKVTQ